MTGGLESDYNNHEWVLVWSQIFTIVDSLCLQHVYDIYICPLYLL